MCCVQKSQKALPEKSEVSVQSHLRDHQDFWSLYGATELESTFSTTGQKSYPLKTTLREKGFRYASHPTLTCSRTVAKLMTGPAFPLWFKSLKPQQKHIWVFAKGSQL